ncbi:hypothetical protein BpHYR1_008886 [Brachionus plicatilis]|uniref:Uncharacterized protein n=1 Tax=Brachionus plicatilis TaxID=10195 RepID=A0A3M7R7M7_BRAPC|nr:hypothetical protein BpHYR1_008886 [Brachionus plicatilis]
MGGQLFVRKKGAVKNAVYYLAKKIKKTSLASYVFLSQAGHILRQECLRRRLTRKTSMEADQAKNI